MRTNLQSIGIPVLLLLVALCIGLWKNFCETGSVSAPDNGAISTSGARKQAVGDSLVTDDGSPTIEVSGVGKLPYKNVEIKKDFNEVMLACKMFSEGEMKLRKEHGRISPIDIYTNENGEIVHLSYQKGRYKTKSRDREFISDIESLTGEYDTVFKIVSYGVPGLKLEPCELLKNMLNMSFSTIAADTKGQLEIEATPVMAEVMPNSRCDPKYIGKKYAMLLEKRSSGKSQEPDIAFYQKYDQDQLIEREWSLRPLLPNPDDPSDLMPQISKGANLLEPYLDAWEARQAKKHNDHPSKR